MQRETYDYIITGMGCAGLSLAMHLVQHPSLQEKRILLVDEKEKNKNDRTWCFWEKESGLFASIVFKQWEQLWLYNQGVAKELSIAPYQYKMIRGLQFYDYCLSALSKQPNITIRYGKVASLFSATETGIVFNGERINAHYVFNSILFEKPRLRKKDIWLLQHFKGWMIETPAAAFDPRTATLMDFRVTQKWGTAFCYVLPVTANKALVEFTLFTPELLKPEEYEEELQRYVHAVLGITDYTIEETEFGVIPMTNHRFAASQQNIVHIGTAGGQTKGSSGYTFYFIQQHSKAIAQRLAQGKAPFVAPPSKRFHFYDSVLLQVLKNASVPGDQIFTTLFRKNSPQEVLDFLNNASTLATEIKIISTLPTLPFFTAALRQTI